MRSSGQRAKKIDDRSRKNPLSHKSDGRLREFYMNRRYIIISLKPPTANWHQPNRLMLMPFYVIPPLTSIWPYRSFQLY